MFTLYCLIRARRKPTPTAARTDKKGKGKEAKGEKEDPERPLGPNLTND